MKLVFICAPFRAGTALGIARNVAAAQEIALEVWKMGAAAYCPHLNTANFHRSLPDEVFLDGHIEVLKRCDAILIVPDGNMSCTEGMRGEMRAAAEARVRAFDNLKRLEEWLRE